LSISRLFHAFSRLWLPLALLAIAGAVTASERDPIEVRAWPARVWAFLGEQAGQAGSAAVSALFDALDEIDLYSMDVGRDARLGIEFDREVYDNSDTFNTWTVIDRAKVKLEGGAPEGWTSLPAEATTGALGGPFISAVFEPKLSLEWADVRQVATLGFTKRRKLEELEQGRAALRRELEERYVDRSASGTGARAEPEPEPDPNVRETNPYTPWYYWDPSIRARFSRALNVFTFPLRTPLSVGAFRRRMQDGEVISWSTVGRVEVGAEVGWAIVPDLSLRSSGISYRLAAIAEGQYRISVLREDARFARIKLSTEAGFGTHRRITVGVSKEKAYGGLLLFRGTKLEQSGVLAQDLRIVPIEWDKTSIRTKFFDVGYRYDLDQEDGRDAYHRAVLGAFSLSDEIAKRDLGAAAPAVERVFHRVGKSKDVEAVGRVSISGIYEKERGRKLRALEAVIDLPDGTHHVSQSIAEGTSSKKGLFGANRE
jgi:hypothetical protein